MSTIILTPTRVIPAPRAEQRSAGRAVDLRGSERRSSVRLTRRGRLVVFLAGLLVAMTAGFVLATGSTATEHSEPTTTIQVGDGETLWQIAGSLAVEGHTADMVEHIKDLNGLHGSALVAGQELRVPLAD